MVSTERMTEDELAEQARTFDFWNQSYGEDPYPLLERFREGCPVIESEANGGYRVFTRYDDVADALRDHGTFTSKMITIPPAPVGVEVPSPFRDGETGGGVAPPLDFDPPEHTSYRRMLLPFFTPARTEKLEPTARANARALIAELQGKPGCELMTQFAFRIPTAVIAEILGVDPADYEIFEVWIGQIVDHDVEEAAAAMAVFPDINVYFNRLLEARRTDPQDDLLTFLLTAEVDGQPLADYQRVSTAQLLLTAGIDTTANTMATAIWWLAQHPEERAQLVARPELIESAVEEFLRMYAPVSVARGVMRDVEIAGCPIPARSSVLMSIPSANRDESKFDHASTMDFEREVNPHIAFGMGVHRCIGAHIARMELRVGLEEWLQVFPDFELDGGPEAQTWKGGPIKGPKRIHLTFGG